MPICKNCKSRIDKFNKDRCPICGVENPFEGVTSDTIEITSSIDVDNMNFNPRKKKVFLLYSMLLGFFGVQFFYLYKTKLAIISSSTNIVVIVLGGFLLGYFTTFGYGAGFGIFIALMFLINTLVGLYVFKKPNLKDGRGEFII